MLVAGQCGAGFGGSRAGERENPRAGGHTEVRQSLKRSWDLNANSPVNTPGYSTRWRGKSRPMQPNSEFIRAGIGVNSGRAERR